MGNYFLFERFPPKGDGPIPARLQYRVNPGGAGASPTRSTRVPQIRQISNKTISDIKLIRTDTIRFDLGQGPRSDSCKQLLWADIWPDSVIVVGVT